MEMSFRINFRLWLFKSILKLMTTRLRREFSSALDNPEAAQKKILNRILQLTGAAELPAKATVYNDYPRDKSWNLEPIKFYETTSGSSGLKKKIPYTKSQLKLFENMFLLWADDILTNVNLKSGKFFMSISPQLKNMGLNSDLDYLNPFLRWLIKPFLAVGMDEFKAANGSEFLLNISMKLLQQNDLEVVSIWSPTYFLAIIESICENIESIQDEKIKLRVRNREWQLLWPNLKFISCWADSTSHQGFCELKSLFPGVRFQAKGLLATEAAITIPWIEASGPVPLWNEVYLEYKDEADNFQPLYQITPGKLGEIFCSTPGGLLRYCLGDIIKCNGKYKQSPIINFVQRRGEVSDLVGEKLDASMVMQVFSNLGEARWLLAASEDHYTFVTDSNFSSSSIEEKLRAIHHYNLARELNQLKSVVTIYLPDLRNRLDCYYQDKKIKLGDIKVQYLWSDSQVVNFLMNLKSADSSLTKQVAKDLI